jgi:hypothetical protein
MEKELIAHWESKGKKYWLSLYKDESGYSYKGDNCGGFLGSITNVEAFQRMQIELDCWPSRAYRKQ